MFTLRMRPSWMIALFTLLLAVSFSRVMLADEDDDGEDVKLTDVPKETLDAALKAVPGIVLTEAEKKTIGSGVLYELNGKVGDKEYEVTVSADGKTISAQLDDDDDDKDMENGNKGGNDDEDDDDDDDDDD